DAARAATVDRSHSQPARGSTTPGAHDAARAVRKPKTRRASAYALAIADVAEVAAGLDRGSALELARAKFLRALSTTTVKRRIEEGALQRCHRSVNGALAPTGHAGKSVLSCAAEGYPVTWG